MWLYWLQPSPCSPVSWGAPSTPLHSAFRTLIFSSLWTWLLHILNDFLWLPCTTEHSGACLPAPDLLKCCMFACLLVFVALGHKTKDLCMLGKQKHQSYILSLSGHFNMSNDRKICETQEGASLNTWNFLLQKKITKFHTNIIFFFETGFLSVALAVLKLIL